MKRQPVRQRIAVLAIGFIILTVILLLLIPGVRARVVMAVSSRQQYAQSPLKEKGIRVDLPAGEGWFEDMLFYHDSQGFKTKDQGPLELSIYYTFGAFDHGRSQVYTPGSGYYASFYGAYLITGAPLPEADAYLVGSIAAYDYETLILKALGHPSPNGTFKVREVEIRAESELLGFSDWTRYDVRIEAPGVAHERRDFRLHYWQFGVPPELESVQSYESVDLNGRVYVKVFEDQELIVMVYLICESYDVLEHTDVRLQESGHLVIHE